MGSGQLAILFVSSLGVVWRTSHIELDREQHLLAVARSRYCHRGIYEMIDLWKVYV